MNREARKDQHVILARSLKTQSHSDFDSMRFIHDAFVDINYEAVSFETEVFNTKMDIPIYINAMTGGSRYTEKINRQLAYVARACNIMMAVGSQKAALHDPSMIESYRCVRDENPTGFILANVGIDSTLDQAQAAVDMIGANALQIHLNRPQELVMPEGDRDFGDWTNRLKQIVNGVSVPVIVKEVGFGLSAKTINKLTQLGVEWFDLAGQGGTNFIEIEDRRRKVPRYEYLYDYGLTTIEALMQNKDNPKINYLASGGIRNPLDIVKCLALGAKSVGMAGIVLKMIDQVGPEETVVLLKEWVDDIRMIMTLVGACDLQQLQQAEWTYQR